MAIAIPQQIYSQFKGIREINGANSGGAISALSAKNVEFFNSDIGGGVGIRTVEGSQLSYELPNGYTGVKCFASKQNGAEYMFAYGENGNTGKLFYWNLAENIQTVQINNTDVTFTATGQCNGITAKQGDHETFIFTNGDTAYTITINPTPTVTKINAVDNASPARTIKWLSMTEWNGFLVVASQYGVHSSHKNNFYKWNDPVQSSTASVDSWYVDFGKPVTAVKAFSTGLLIFTGSDVSHLSASPNLANGVLSNVAMNGCYSYESIVSHGLFLFFYDDEQRNIFYIKQTDTGLTQPAGPAAMEIKSVFGQKIEKCRLYSCIYDTYNEIWMLINNRVFIFDYNIQEFLEREQSIKSGDTSTVRYLNSVCMFKNKIYSIGADGKIRLEKQTAADNSFYPAEYRTSIINMGSNTNLKKQKTPVLLVLNSNHVNDFYVEVTCNYKEKTPKHFIVKVANQGIYVAGEPPEEDDPTVTFEPYQLYGNTDAQGNPTSINAYFQSENPYKKSVVEISTPQTWYTMSLRFFTLEKYQGFSIESMEIKRLKEKTKTKGR